MAVKESNQPPAVWIHREAKACSHVTIRVGADFYFDDEKIDALTLSNFLFVDQLRKRATKTKSSLH